MLIPSPVPADLWLTWWASATGTEASNALGYWLGTYGALGVVGKAAMACTCLWVTTGIVFSVIREVVLTLVVAIYT